MSKIIQIILVGVFFTFIADFFFFLGIKLHYIDVLGIEVYYNVLFVDNQKWYIFFGVSLIVGLLIHYTPMQVYLPIMILFYFLVFFALYHPVGEALGEWLFMKENVTLHNDKFTFRGDILYIGREKIYFFDKDLNKMIELKKTEIKEKIDG